MFKNEQIDLISNMFLYHRIKEFIFKNCAYNKKRYKYSNTPKFRIYNTPVMISD